LAARCVAAGVGEVQLAPSLINDTAREEPWIDLASTGSQLALDLIKIERLELGRLLAGIVEVERHQQHPARCATASAPPAQQHCDDVPGSVRPYDQPFFDGRVGAAVSIEEGIAWRGAAHAIWALGIPAEPSGAAVKNPIGVGLTCVIMAVADV
jgi:hypothetical protein